MVIFLAGFVEGEGSFNVSLRRKADYKVNWQVVMSFNVSQKDPTILYMLRDQLNCGIIKVRKGDRLHSFDATNPDDLIKCVIPYFRKYRINDVFPLQESSETTRRLRQLAE